MTLEMMRQLRRLEVERRPEACLGCGCEHNCSTRGCAVLQSAYLELLNIEMIKGGLAKMPRDDTLTVDAVLEILRGEVM